MDKNTCFFYPLLYPRGGGGLTCFRKTHQLKLQFFLRITHIGGVSTEMVNMEELGLLEVQGPGEELCQGARESQYQECNLESLDTSLDIKTIIQKFSIPVLISRL